MVWPACRNEVKPRWWRVYLDWLALAVRRDRALQGCKPERSPNARARTDLDRAAEVKTLHLRTIRAFSEQYAASLGEADRRYLKPTMPSALGMFPKGMFEAYT